MKKILISLIGFVALALVTQSAWGYGFGYVYQLNPDGVAHLNNWVDACLSDGGEIGDKHLATTVDTHLKITQETKAMQSELMAKSNELKRLQETPGYDQARANALERQISELRNKIEMSYPKYTDRAGFTCGMGRFWGAVIISG